MQSDPQDEQWTLPDSRDDEAPATVGEDREMPPTEPSDAPPPKTPPDATPPRMPSPPRMPVGGPPPSAWGSPPQPTPERPGPTELTPRSVGGPATFPAGDTPVEPAGPTEAPAVEHETLLADPAGPNAVSRSEGESDVGPAMGVVRPGPTTAVAPIVQGDWLASVCPYLTSDDGAYRSASPDEGHRCTAQAPAATLPLAFQERFCLTDRHPRCEMYKFAQETNASGGIPVDQVPPTDPPTPRARPAGGGGPNRPLLATLAGIAGVIVFVLLVIAFMGSCSGDGEPAPGTDGVPDGQATEAPPSTPRPTPTATPGAEETSGPEAEATPDAVAGETVRILYEIQPDEALLRVSETFGVSRNRIRRENPELTELDRTDLPGTIIELPIMGDMTLAEAEALPGFRGLVSEIEDAAES